MKKTLVCPVGDQPEAVFPALREFSVEHAHLLTHASYTKQAQQLRNDLDKFSIPYSEQELTDDLWEDTFVKIADFANTYPKRAQIVVHTGVGDRVMQCAATSASFVNGLQAVNGTKDTLFGLPIMRFEYYSALNERKRKIMSTLTSGSKSLLAISKELGVSLSLLSYHVHGNRKSEGLVDMGLVELSEKKNQTFISLTAMGRLILRGSVPQAAV